MGCSNSSNRAGAEVWEVGQQVLEDGPKSTQVAEKGFMKHYKPGAVIGQGQFGKVNMCQKVAATGTNDRQYAVKLIKKAMFTEEPSEAICTRHEVALTVDLSHVNLAKTYEAFEDPKAIYIIMELVEGGDMIRYIQEMNYHSAFTNDGWLSEQVVLFIAKQVLEGVQYMASKSIVHRDLKPENIMLTEPANEKYWESTVVKLVDFGTARNVSNGMCYTMIGTEAYAAPEVLLKGGKKPYGLSADMWSVGIIFYYLMSGALPVNLVSEESDQRLHKQQLARLMKGNFEVSGDEVPAIWTKIPESLKSLISNMNNPSVAARDTAAKALQHPSLKNVKEATPKVNKVEAPPAPVAAPEEVKVEPAASSSWFG